METRSENQRLSARDLSCSDDYANGPCYAEIAAIIVVGLLHVAIELALSEDASRAYNLTVSAVFVVYVGWRVTRSHGVLRAWGIRRDNFWPALCAQLGFAAAGASALIGFGAATDSLNLPATFLLTLTLYPIWGIAQQFALQNLIARNLTGVLSNPLGISLAASALFAAAHFPRLDLAFLTLVAGVFLTRIYRNRPNLWAAGIAHGLLGAFAVHIVLEKDPGRRLLEVLFG